MKNWVVQYVYATEKDEQGVSISHIKAETLEKAKEIAVEQAVAEEYVFNVYQQSEEQFLGSVRHDANMKVGKGQMIDADDDI